MKNNSVSLKTMAIKARVYNKIRTSLYKKRLDQISPQDKIKLFDEWFNENYLAHWELNDYKKKRQDKAALYKARVERGYKFKKKQTKEEREKYLADKR